MYATAPIQKRAVAAAALIVNKGTFTVHQLRQELSYMSCITYTSRRYYKTKA